MPAVTNDDPEALERRYEEIQAAHRERHAQLQRDAQAGLSSDERSRSADHVIAIGRTERSCWSEYAIGGTARISMSFDNDRSDQRPKVRIAERQAEHLSQFT